MSEAGEAAGAPLLGAGVHVNAGAGPAEHQIKGKQSCLNSLPPGSGGHSAHMTSYSDSGYQDSSLSHYSNQNVVRTEPRSSLSRSPRAEGQTSGQVSLMAGPFMWRHPCF